MSSEVWATICPPKIEQSPNQPTRTLYLTTLPLEIRHVIYNYLLVSTGISDPESSEMDGMIQLHSLNSKYSPTMDPAVLRTCSQIYYEAASILYSENIFAFSRPSHLLEFFERIGPFHVKKVKTLDIWVQYHCKGDWAELFEKVAEDAKGLRRIVIAWDAKVFEEPEEQKCGLGDNVEFVQALGKVQNLETLELRGCYAKRWPEYLERKTGAKVIAKKGHFEEMKDVELLKTFEEYQRGTEDLWP